MYIPNALWASRSIRRLGCTATSWNRFSPSSTVHTKQRQKQTEIYTESDKCMFTFKYIIATQIFTIEHKQRSDMSWDMCGLFVTSQFLW